MITPDAIGRGSWGRWRTVGLNLAGAALLLFALTFLPPDNSLAEVQASGVLRVCVPESMPPLVTDDPERPGYDLELLDLIARDLGVRLAINRNAAIGADFNPRNWRLTRSQCQVIAGGVVDNESARGFLELLPTGLQTGWAAIGGDDMLSQVGGTAAVFPGPIGLDRLALSRYLRSKKFRILTIPSAAQLLDALDDGTADIAISDRQTLAAINSENARIHWVSEKELGVFDLAFGLWKGDATLLRAMRDSHRKLRSSGLADSLSTRYGAPANATISP